MSDATKIARDLAEKVSLGHSSPHREIAGVLYQLAAAIEGLERQIAAIDKRLDRG